MFQNLSISNFFNYLSLQIQQRWLMSIKQSSHTSLYFNIKLKFIMNCSMIKSCVRKMAFALLSLRKQFSFSLFVYVLKSENFSHIKIISLPFAHLSSILSVRLAKFSHKKKVEKLRKLSVFVEIRNCEYLMLIFEQ